MGLFDQIASAVIDKVAGEGSSAGGVAHSVLDFISNHEGGLGGLVDNLKNGGLASEVSSWVGTGQNLPVSAEQIESALGSGVLGDLAQKAGIDPASVSGHIAELLPSIIDKLTPDGEVGEHSVVQEGLAVLGKLFR